MPTNRYVLRRSSRAKLTHSQTMELWLGASHNGSAFASDEHKRAAWFHHRARLMGWWGKNGRRPMAWWTYEAREIGLRYPGYEYERSFLWETPNVLSEEERTELEREWRRQWDRCWEDESFFHCSGPDKILTGDEARVRHLVWADVPPELVYKWLDERERCGLIVREVQEESQQGEPVAETSSQLQNEPHAG